MMHDSASVIRLPSIVPQREYVEAGGLMTYGENLASFSALSLRRFVRGQDFQRLDARRLADRSTDPVSSRGQPKDR
jgi:hypothetical protein